MKLISILSLVISSFALAFVVWINCLNTASSHGPDDALQRLQDVESRTAEALSRLNELERRYTALSHAANSVIAPKVTVPALPLPVDGSYTVERDAVVYAQDAKLRIGTDASVSSPRGVMVSDLEQKMVVGDLTLETSQGTVQADGAVIDVREQKMTAKRMKGTFAGKSNKLPEPIPAIGTSPANEKNKE